MNGFVDLLVVLSTFALASGSLWYAGRFSRRRS